MNPSTPGWIDKFGHLVQEHRDAFTDFQHLYGGLKQVGFVYGINIKIPRFIDPEYNFSDDEKAKINLLTALYFTFKLERAQSDFSAFVETIFKFYKELGVGNITFFQKILAGSKTSAQLEKLLDSRVYIGENMLSKTFNSIITNSLLFIDVLTFKYFLNGGQHMLEHAELLEYLTINITYHALSSKDRKKEDDTLVQAFESSLTFIAEDEQEFDGSYRQKLLHNSAIWENQYLLDVACLTIWEDKTVEFQESEFIYGIGADLGFDKKRIGTALEEVTAFFSKNAETVAYLKSENFALQFYDNMSKTVNKLIMRNSKRLQKELQDSKELVALLSKSTQSNLSPAERKKVKSQLIDIFKSIPSLAIFLLPGGAVLLAIFIKLIPQLLPSSFDDNRIEN